MVNNLSYTYEILSVSTEGRFMEVLYTTEGKEPIKVGVRLPFEGESLEQIIHIHSPVRYWIEQETPVANVSVGVTGTYSPPVSDKTLESVKSEKTAELAQWRYARENGFIIVNDKTISTSRESRVSLTEIFINFSNDLFPQIVYKTINGDFITLNKDQFTTLYEAVFLHVQNCFEQEKNFFTLINSCTTIEEVENISFGISSNTMEVVL